MEFVIRKAGYEDIPGIMAVMKDAQKAMEHPEWFCSDREEYMKKHIETYGFTIVAEPVSGSSIAGNSLTGGSLTGGSLAGFFLIKFPGLSEENLGHLLNYSEEELQRPSIWIWRLCIHPGRETAFSPVCSVRRKKCLLIPLFRGTGFLRLYILTTAIACIICKVTAMRS